MVLKFKTLSTKSNLSFFKARAISVSIVTTANPLNKSKFESEIRFN